MEGLGFATRLGVTIVLLILTGIGAGLGMDALMGTTPIFLLVGAIVGIVFSLWGIFKLTESFREPIFKKKKKK